MGNFQDWFDRFSGYALHPPRPAKRSGCCESLVPAGRTLWLPAPDREEPAPCPLYACPGCKRLYALYRGDYLLVEHPLRYRITADKAGEKI